MSARERSTTTAKQKKKRDSKKEGSAKKTAAKKKPHMPAWQELVAMLAGSRYVQKVAILAKLKALGYDVNVDSVSYVMTAARKRGKLCVYTGPDTGYTATPDGDEALKDIRKRRRISAAWIRNVRAVVAYVKKNQARLIASMSADDIIELRKEMKYHAAMLTSIKSHCAANGLK